MRPTDDPDAGAEKTSNIAEINPEIFVIMASSLSEGEKNGQWGDVMQFKYHTKSGSMYIHTIDAYGNDWYKLDKAGRRVDLAGAVHLTRKRLQTLITDYPVKAMNRTAFFGKAVAREFFDDVKRHEGARISQTEDSTIFFLTRRGEDLYSIGFSSRVIKIEIIEPKPNQTCDIVIK